MVIRTGQGIDVHKLEPGRALWLGGINIPSPLGSVAHSDGDVLIHSICDALLGAAAQGDIGKHFPDTDNRFKGIDSKLLLKECCRIIGDLGYTVGNIDTTILLEAPKIAPYVGSMRKTISEVMGISEDQVSIKATTTETLGFTGRKEGIAATASVLIFKD